MAKAKAEADAKRQQAQGAAAKARAELAAQKKAKAAKKISYCDHFSAGSLLPHPCFFCRLDRSDHLKLISCSLRMNEIELIQSFSQNN